MNRLEFLKTVGFRGPALMALLTSCVNKEDTYIQALSLTNEQSTATPVVDIPTVNPPTDTTNTNTEGVKLVSSLAITTAALNSISSTKLKIDLNLAANAALLKVGGYLVQNGYVVAQSASGVLVAATQNCSHENKKRIIFNKTEFYCTDHGARFNLNGAGLNSYGSKGIAVYKVATDGNTVVVY